MNNKEVIDKLTAYFITQDPRQIALALASTMVDMHRLLLFRELDPEEKESLRVRCAANSEELIRFLNKGPRETPFQTTNISSDDPEWRETFQKHYAKNKKEGK